MRVTTPSRAYAPARPGVATGRIRVGLGYFPSTQKHVLKSFYVAVDHDAVHHVAVHRILVHRVAAVTIR